MVDGLGDLDVTTSGANSLRTGPDEEGHFGKFGGRFVAETLMPLILDLEAAYREMWERQQRGEPPASFAVIVRATPVPS